MENIKRAQLKGAEELVRNDINAGFDLVFQGNFPVLIKRIWAGRLHLHIEGTFFPLGTKAKMDLKYSE